MLSPDPRLFELRWSIPRKGFSKSHNDAALMKGDIVFPLAHLRRPRKDYDILDPLEAANAHYGILIGSYAKIPRSLPTVEAYQASLVPEL